MKKFISVLLCAVLLTVMVPTFFASAQAPAAAAATVVAQSEEPTGLLATIKGFFELWGGLFKTLLGSEVWEGFGPALKKVLDIVPLGEFIQTVRDMWADIVG